MITRTAAPVPAPPPCATASATLCAPHSHDAADRVGAAPEASAEGLRTLWTSFTVLAVAASAVFTGPAAVDRLLHPRPVDHLAAVAAITLVLRGSVREVGRRLMDGVDPALVDAAEGALREVEGVRGVGALRMRWIGHSLRAEADVVVDGALTVVAAHRVAEAAEQALIRIVPRLLAATVHIDHAPAAHGA